jgi:hypothetical protein
METLNGVLAVLFLAIITEYLTNLIKPLIPKHETEYPITLLISLVLGIILALLLEVDFFAAIGMPSVNDYAAKVFTGIIASGGSTAVHELIQRARTDRYDIQAEIDLKDQE